MAAIELCKNQILETTENTDGRKDLVGRLIRLRIRYFFIIPVVAPTERCGRRLDVLTRILAVGRLDLGLIPDVS